MSTAQAAQEYRFMIRDNADVLNPGDSEDIQNIITDPLPNGAFCYVNAKKALYVLDKHSMATADGSSVLQPIAGPGRWLLFGAGAGSVPPVLAYNTLNNTPAFTCDGTYHQSSGNAFAAAELGNLNRWGFTASGCILTYAGPTLPMLATLTCSVSVTDGTPAQPISAAISFAGDLIGGALGAGDSSGQGLVVESIDGTNWIQIATQRLLTAVSDGSTIRPVFACAAGGGAGAIASLQLVVRAL